MHVQRLLIRPLHWELLLVLCPSSQQRCNSVQALKGQLLRLTQVGTVQSSPLFTVGPPVRSTVRLGFFACGESAALCDKGKERGLLQPAIPRRGPHGELLLMAIYRPSQ